jgi:hypothetical protein
MPNPPKNNAPDKALVKRLREHAMRADSPIAEEAANAIERLSQPQHGGLVEAALREAIEWDGHDSEGIPAVWLDQALVALSSNSPVVGEDAVELERAGQLASWREAKRRMLDVTLPLVRPIPIDTADRYFITKGGAYYRPNAEGYTRDTAEAGRFTLEEAISHSHPNGPNGPRDGIDYVPAPKATDTADRREAIDRLGRLAGRIVANGEARISRLGACHELDAIASLIAVPDGMVLVPREPTEAMIDAGSTCDPEDGCYPVWSAMIAARPGAYS